jgi:hypothetical protein
MTSGNTQAAKAHQKSKGSVEFPEKGKGGLAYFLRLSTLVRRFQYEQLPGVR